MYAYKMLIIVEMSVDLNVWLQYYNLTVGIAGHVTTGNLSPIVITCGQLRTTAKLEYHVFLTMLTSTKYAALTHI